MDIVENMLQSAYVFPKVAKDLRATTPARPPKKTASKAAPKSKPTK
jgi:hypothetical protein